MHFNINDRETTLETKTNLYTTVEKLRCLGCAFYEKQNCVWPAGIPFKCSMAQRKDGNSVIWVEDQSLRGHIKRANQPKSVQP